MEVTEGFVNKVAQSGLVTLDLETLYDKGERVVYDIAENLFHGLMLREKDFRAYVKEHDFTAYADKHVAIVCSTDAIVPTWAYMLLANRMAPYARTVVYGGPDVLETAIFTKAVQGMDVEPYRNERVILKGCADIKIPDVAYVLVTKKLTPVVKSLMYGEPCSTVPIYKRKD